MTGGGKRLAVGMAFALLGVAGLGVADMVSQWLCARVFACAASSYAPIDACEGDARLDMLRFAVWVGPAAAFGAGAFLFGGRRRSLPAWLGFLIALVAAHPSIMAGIR